MSGLGKAVEARFASLSSGLLARKGQAKPAMRPQGFGGFGHMTMGHEDLGWNDMGYDRSEPVQAEADPPSPAAAVLPDTAYPDVQPPVVLRQREALAETFEAEEAYAEPAEAVAAPVLSVKSQARTVRKPVSTDTGAPAVAPHKAPNGKKAAFTLRLDSDRHLRLRLACAVGNRSAQQIVVEALDRLLGEMPAVDDLAGRVPSAE